MLAFRFALRELRGGIKGFGIFIACLVLGVLTISGIGSFTQAIQNGLQEDGQIILGGDVAFTLVHRQAPEEAVSYLRETGQVSTVVTMRSMARLQNGFENPASSLVEFKGVDAAYPLYGRFVSTPDLPFAALTQFQNGYYGAVVAEGLLVRLETQLGDIVRIGSADYELRGVIETEPDQLSGGIGFGPKFLVSLEGMQASGLLQPGSLMEWAYRVGLPDFNASQLQAFIEQFTSRFPDQGWEVRSRMNAAPQIREQSNQFALYLTLVGLTAFLIGGVGVANAVRAFLEKKHGVIAIYKAVGAGKWQVFQIYLWQIFLLAGGAILTGIIIGVALPFLLSGIVTHYIPLPLRTGFYLLPILEAIVCGLFVTLIFSLWSVGRAQNVPASHLLRDDIRDDAKQPSWTIKIALIITLALFAAALLVFAYDRNLTFIYMGIMVAILVLLRLVSWLILIIARNVPKPKSAVIRMMVANIYRPKNLTSIIVLSLGSGVALLACLAQIDLNLTRQLQQSLPEQAPSFFFVDIQNRDLQSFQNLLETEVLNGNFNQAPMMRGRIVAINEVPVSELDIPQEVEWVFRGDRGITYSASVPEGSNITQGEWWGENYQGIPLVSFDNEIGAEIGLNIGDRISVNVLGRTIIAQIANFREVEWQSLNISFVMVFSPNTFVGAPHAHLATLTFPEGAEEADEFALIGKVAAEFPAITTIRVKDALQAVGSIVSNLIIAVRGASSITLIVALLVLGGAIAASQTHRLYDVVVLKTLGATKRQLLSLYALEYGVIGMLTILFGLLAGNLAAALICEFLFNIRFSSYIMSNLTLGFFALFAILILGLFGTWRVLTIKPAHKLRDL